MGSTLGRGGFSRIRFPGDAVIFQQMSKKIGRKGSWRWNHNLYRWSKHQTRPFNFKRYCSLNEPCENFNERFPLIQIMVMTNFASIRPLYPIRKKSCKTISIKDNFNSSLSLWWFQINTWNCYENFNQRKHNCVYVKYVPRRLEWNADLEPG